MVGKGFDALDPKLRIPTTESQAPLARLEDEVSWLVLLCPRGDIDVNEMWSELL